ncbi:7285_t:CDS:2, partial [Racocetra persica]
IRQINTNKEYAPSSLINCIKLLSVYILKHPRGNKIFNISNRKEFSHLWEVFNRKMKKLKKDGIISHHHDILTETELRTIFQHNLVSSNTPQGLQYRVFMWCCLLFQPRGGEHYNLSISQFVFTSNGSIYFMKYSQKNDQDGKGVPMDTTMSITGHKTLSLLIDSVGTLPSNSQEESINMNISFSQNNSLQSEGEIETDAIPTKRKNSFEPMSLISPTLMKPFRQPLQTSSIQCIDSTSYEAGASGTTVVKNYYINAQTVNIS